jgi:UDP-2,3-diacylglucosamine pyrophosphatase LpxH
VIGNHDLELHWPLVQGEIRDALNLPDDVQTQLRFCEWFYISGGDTLVQHGNQFDAYCMCDDPINPTVKFRSPPRIRLPFGDIAGRLMLNGMGMFNPYVEESFLGGLRAHLIFFYKYVIRVQPFLLLTWLWSAMATLVVSLREGFLPSVKHPETLARRVDDIARRSNSSAGVVIALRATGVHPAIFNPWKIARELWLDRALLLFVGALVSFQIFSVFNVFVRLSVLWVAVPFAVFLLPFVFYARSVQSEVRETELNIHKRLPTAARIAGVSRVILGHTHRERHTGIRGIELINTGTWSSAYHDVECTVPYGRKCFAWIHPDPAGEGRIAQLRVWNDPGSEAFLPDAPPGGLRTKRLEARRRRREDAVATASRDSIPAIRPVDPNTP